MQLISPNAISSGLYNLLSEQSKPREMKHWHASSIAQCPRAQYLARKGILPINKPTGAKILRWSVGHKMEEAIRPYVKQLFPKLESNQRIFSEKLDLTGEYDNYDPESGFLIEIKSVGPRAARNRRKEEDRHHLRGDGAYLAHQWQQHAYVLLLKEQGIKVNGIIYLYITLEGLLIPYTTGVNEDVLLDVTNTLVLLNASWQAQTAPQCECQPENPLWGSVVQFCDYRDQDKCCSLSLLTVNERLPL